MEPQIMPYLTTGGHGAPKERPGGDFDSFWCASRAAPCPKKRVRKMTPKMDPSKIEILGLFWIMPVDFGRPGRVRGSCLALEFET